MKDKRPRLNAEEAAELLGVATKTIRKMTHEGRIPVIRLSARCVRYDRAALEEWLESRTVKERSCK